MDAHAVSEHDAQTSTLDPQPASAETPQETQARVLAAGGKEAWRTLCARVGAVRRAFQDHHGVDRLTKPMKDWTWRAAVAEFDGQQAGRAGPAVDVGAWRPVEGAGLRVEGQNAADPQPSTGSAGSALNAQPIDADVPEVALADEVEWAYQQLPEFQRAVKDQRARRQEQILNAAPSGGARSWLQFAASNPSKFMGDVVPKILGKREEAAAAAQGDPAVFRDDQRKQFALLELLEREG